jgi:hypothetical protein
MDNVRHQWRARLVAALLAAVVVPAAAAAQITTSEQSAAIVEFPLVRLDRARGVDTVFRITNTIDEPVAVSCFYVDESRRCSNGNSICFDNADCGEGICSPASAQTNFFFRLTARQPLVWVLSDGLAPQEFPVPLVDNFIPPVAGDRFEGWMKCVALRPDQEPGDTNCLMGTAVLYEHTVENLDAAEYGAVGVQAIAGASDGDRELLIGVEYSGCSNVLLFDHFFDGAVDPAAATRSIDTRPALVPCTLDLSFSTFSDPSIQYSIFNEFGQQFTLEGTRTGTRMGSLSEIDGQEREASPFFAAVAGSLTGQTRLRSVQSGVLGIAIEERSDLADPSHKSRAAFNLGGAGTRGAVDTVVLP